jgi:hypothetical protein
MRIARRRAFESADYDGWRIGLRPIVSPRARCDRPASWRDELGIRCANCGRRPGGSVIEPHFLGDARRRRLEQTGRSSGGGPLAGRCEDEGKFLIDSGF